MSVRALHLVPELTAYMTTIICVSQGYAGLAWVRYDATFRRQAALTNNLCWSMINSTLYTMCFTGMAFQTKRCKLCFATSHTERVCAQQGDPDPGMRNRLKAIESAIPAMAWRGLLVSHAANVMPGAACTLDVVTCSVCRGPHPASKCSTCGSQQKGGIGPHAPNHQFRQPKRPY